MRFIQSQLYGITPWDPAVWLLAGLVVCVGMLLALLRPAARVLGTDAAEILRTH